MLPMPQLLHRARALTLLAFAALANVSAADTVNTRALTITELAPGVFTIRHPDPTDDFPDGNTTVVIGSRGVLVVDTGYLPSTARADIERIRAITDKPVRWIVNTHWHNDHVGGNRSYLEAFPEAKIVGHTITRAMMESRIRPFVARMISDESVFGRLRAQQRELLRSGRDEKGQAVTDAQRAGTERALALAEKALAEFRSFALQPPTQTFDDALDIDLGDRSVQLRFLGRGNTGGDVVAWLPKERILVAGDLVDHPVPYAFGGYPSEWIATLGKLLQFDARAIVPGHGEVQRDRRYIARVVELLQAVTAQAEVILAQRGSSVSVDDMTRAIDLSAFRREMAGDDPDNQEFFDASMASLIRLAYAEARAR
jgi:glyoxylase-like metal-dependent hydrolase (beta-lactamase superfamily II)